MLFKMSEVESSSVVLGNLTSQSFVGIQGDNHRAQITFVKFYGKNYLEWSQSTRMYIDGKGKLGYINSRIVKPTYGKWEAGNLTVMSWLLNLMEPSISRGFLFLKTTKEI